MICIFTLPVWFGMTGVWLVASVTEIATLFICIYYLYRDSRKEYVKADIGLVGMAER